MESAVFNIRIVSPLTPVSEHARIEDTQRGDIIEITDRPVYRVDPQTRACTDALQRFVVGDRHSLRPIQ